MTQSFYLSILNLTVFCVTAALYGKRFFLSYIANIVSYRQSLLYFTFIIWCSITTYNAINIGESFRVISDNVNYLVALIMLVFCFQNIDKPKDYVINVFIFILILEVLAILVLVYLDILSGSFDLSAREARYKGLTGNINIAAFSMALKLPFVFYKVFTKKNIYFHYLIFFLVSFIIIYLHKTRGAILTLFFEIIFLVLFSIYDRVKNHNKQKRLYVFGVILFFVFGINSSLNSYFKANQSTIDRISTITDFGETSISQRLRFYNQSFQTFLDNPILGIGIGNWELKSIDTDSENILGYTVPYHAHNDYLELLAETGLIGFLLFYGLIFFTLYKLVRAYLNKKETNFFNVFIVLGILVYLIDALFNFPFARPIQQLNLIGFVSLSIYLTQQKSFEINKHKVLTPIFNIITFSFLLLIPLTLYSSYRVYNAYTQHYYLLGQFNANTYTQKLEQVLEYEDVYPSVLPTTIPAITMKGMFYVKKNNDYETAKKYFREGIKYNPYLMLSETMLGYCFLMENKLDSAKYYSEKAFEKMPKNPIHFVHYILALQGLNDTLGIKTARERIKNTGFDDEIVDQLYLQTMAKILDKDNSGIVLNNLSRDLLNTNNDKLKGSVYVLEYGKELVREAFLLHEEGKKLFEDKKYGDAAIKFEKASELNALEIPYHENAINAHLQNQNFKRALELCDKVISDINTSPKIKYMKAITLLSMNNNEEACIVLQDIILNHREFYFPVGLFSEYCK